MSLAFGLNEGALRAFENIRDALAVDGVNPYDRDAFLMHRAVVELVYGGRPSEGVGAAIDELAAWTHLVYLFWAEGEHTVTVDTRDLGVILSGGGPPAGPPARPPAYFATAGRKLWGSPTEAGPEPLDGWFAARDGDRLMVAAMFGGRAERGGASVVAVEGPEPVGLVRPDGTALFAPVLDGGSAAGLHSVTGMEELLALAWRVEQWRGGRA
jgi:hypothetical protein